jgi:hypothetical protein
VGTSRKRVSVKNYSQQAASIATVGVLDKGPHTGRSNAKAKEEDIISMKRHPGDLLSISSYQALCNDKKDWPNVEAKDQCAVQVMLYLPYFHLDL